MIHAKNDLAFKNAARNGHLETIKYLVSLEENPRKRSKMIHTSDDSAFLFAAEKGHLDVLIILLSLEQFTEAKSKMIHAKNDLAFKNAARSVHLETIKYLVIRDPFYGWPEGKNLTSFNFYRNIDINSLSKISTLCKYLFSTERNAAKNCEDNISIIDLPNDVLYKILQNLAQVNDDYINQIKIESVVQAFTYDSNTYSDGLVGFIYRYESALKELGAEVETSTTDFE